MIIAWALVAVNTVSLICWIVLLASIYRYKKRLALLFEEKDE